MIAYILSVKNPPSKVGKLPYVVNGSYMGNGKDSTKTRCRVVGLILDSNNMISQKFVEYE